MGGELGKSADPWGLAQSSEEDLLETGSSSLDRKGIS